MATYRTRAGDVLDLIAREQLGAEHLVIDLVEANPGSGSWPEVLPAGVLVTLPDVGPLVTQPVIRLWGKP